MRIKIITVKVYASGVCEHASRTIIVIIEFIDIEYVQYLRRSLCAISITSSTSQTCSSLPFRPPVKNIRTMNTCNPAIAIIKPDSIKLKFHIRLSVLLTVLKFLFSRVRKYFCCLVNVET